jgi:hypothetical protein
LKTNKDEVHDDFKIKPFCKAYNLRHPFSIPNPYKIEETKWGKITNKVLQKLKLPYKGLHVRASDVEKLAEIGLKVNIDGDHLFVEMIEA